MSSSHVSIPVEELKSVIDAINAVLDTSVMVRRRFGSLDDQLVKDAGNFDDLCDSLEKAVQAGFEEQFAGLLRDARITVSSYQSMRGAINSANQSNVAYSNSLERLRDTFQDICARA